MSLGTGVGRPSALAMLPATGRTSVAGILGDPVEHSLSPAMQNAAFQASGLDAVYVPLRVRPADLPAAIEGLRALGFLGLNVTVPHKERVLPLLDSVSSEARMLGAVNTIVARRGRLIGHNTDARGFRAALAAARVRLRGRSAIVIGAGGAARAVITVLAREGCSSVDVVNRTPGRARRLRRDSGRSARHVAVHEWSLLGDAEALRRTGLIVNCTPLGLRGEIVPGLSYGATSRRCVFVDLVYRPGGTPFARRARRIGRRTVDGAGMLLYQGALAFTLWTGRRAPLSVMNRALHQALANTGR